MSTPWQTEVIAQPAASRPNGLHCARTFYTQPPDEPATGHFHDHFPTRRASWKVALEVISDFANGCYTVARGATFQHTECPRSTGFLASCEEKRGEAYA